MNTEKKSWLSRLGSAIKKSTSNISNGIQEVFSSKGLSLTKEQLEDLRDVLISGDVGVDVADNLCKLLQKQHFKNIDELKVFLANEISKIISDYTKPFSIEELDKTQVILVAGVNGSGKTTTIAKLSQKLKEQGKTVEWAACDTFRAAAVDQMQIWADKLGVNLYKLESEGKKVDPSAVAFKAFESALKNKTDVLFVDTAGRLPNNENLMQELAKIVRTLRKINENAPHQSLLILDGTTGQNTFTQVELFRKVLPITSIIVTKLDGSAKGGFLVGLCQKFKINVSAIGIGETADSLDYLDANIFSKSLMGINI